MDDNDGDDDDDDIKESVSFWVTITCVCVSVCAHKLYVELVHKKKLLFPCWKLVWKYFIPMLISDWFSVKTNGNLCAYHAVIPMPHYVFFEMILTMGFSIPMKFPYWINRFCTYFHSWILYSHGISMMEK